MNIQRHSRSFILPNPNQIGQFKPLNSSASGYSYQKNNQAYFGKHSFSLPKALVPFMIFALKPSKGLPNVLDLLCDKKSDLDKKITSKELPGPGEEIVGAPDVINHVASVNGRQKTIVRPEVKEIFTFERYINYKYDNPKPLSEEEWSKVTSKLDHLSKLSSEKAFSVKRAAKKIKKDLIYDIRTLEMTRAINGDRPPWGFSTYHFNEMVDSDDVIEVTLSSLIDLDNDGRITKKQLFNMMELLFRPKEKSERYSPIRDGMNRAARLIKMQRAFSKFMDQGVIQSKAELEAISNILFDPDQFFYKHLQVNPEDGPWNPLGDYRGNESGFFEVLHSIERSLSPFLKSSVPAKDRQAVLNTVKRQYILSVIKNNVILVHTNKKDHSGNIELNGRIYMRKPGSYRNESPTPYIYSWSADSVKVDINGPNIASADKLPSLNAITTGDSEFITTKVVRDKNDIYTKDLSSYQTTNKFLEYDALLKVKAIEENPEVMKHLEDFRQDLEHYFPGAKGGWNEKIWEDSLSSLETQMKPMMDSLYRHFGYSHSKLNLRKSLKGFAWGTASVPYAPTQTPTVCLDFKKMFQYSRAKLEKKSPGAWKKEELAPELFENFLKLLVHEMTHVASHRIDSTEQAIIDKGGSVGEQMDVYHKEVKRDLWTIYSPNHYDDRLEDVTYDGFDFKSQIFTMYKGQITERGAYTAQYSEALKELILKIETQCKAK